MGYIKGIKNNYSECDSRHCNEVAVADAEGWSSFKSSSRTYTWCPQHSMTAYNMGLLDSEPTWKRKP